MLKLGQIDLFKGWPSPSLLPSNLILSASTTVLRDANLAVPALLYGPDPGYEPLREAIAAWLSKFYCSPSTVPTRICITGGASQNLANILQVYTDPIFTESICMVEPTYYLACRIFEDSGFAGRLKGVPEDEEGIDLNFLADHLQRSASLKIKTQPLKTPQAYQKFYKHVIYCIPTFSNPTGKTMSLCRRHQLLSLARQHDALIITDDVYDFLHFSSPASAPYTSPPRLVDLDAAADGFGNTVSNGSFSKIIAPGMRTGWTEASPQFTIGLSKCGSTMSGGAPSQLNAAILAEALKTGGLERHLESVLRPALRRRAAIIEVAVRRWLVPLGCETNERVEGGYFIWVKLPRKVSADDLVQKAQLEVNLLVCSSGTCRVSGNGEKRVASEGKREGLRICFAWEDESKLEEGVRRLGCVLKDLVEGHAKRILRREGQPGGAEVEARM